MPRAYVVPKPGQQLSEQEVVAFVDERVSAFKNLNPNPDPNPNPNPSPSPRTLTQCRATQVP